MHSVNLDLLRASSAHSSDGRARDPHALHRAEVIAMDRAARRDAWRARLARVRALLALRADRPAARPCVDRP